MDVAVYYFVIRLQKWFTNHANAIFRFKCILIELFKYILRNKYSYFQIDLSYHIHNYLLNRWNWKSYIMINSLQEKGRFSLEKKKNNKYKM